MLELNRKIDHDNFFQRLFLSVLTVTYHWTLCSLYIVKTSLNETGVQLITFFVVCFVYCCMHYTVRLSSN